MVPLNVMLWRQRRADLARVAELEVENTELSNLLDDWETRATEAISRNEHLIQLNRQLFRDQFRLLKLVSERAEPETNQLPIINPDEGPPIETEPWQLG